MRGKEEEAGKQRKMKREEERARNRGPETGNEMVGRQKEEREREKRTEIHQSIEIQKRHESITCLTSSGFS